MTYTNFSLSEALRGESVIADSDIGIYNETNQIAIKYRLLVHVTVSCGPTQYLFRSQANICLAWVEPENVDCILKKRGGCCGQKRPGVFVLANAADVRRWTNKGGR